MIGWFVVPTVLVLVTVAIVNFFAYQTVTEDLVVARDKDLLRLSALQLATSFEDYEIRLYDAARDSGLLTKDSDLKPNSLGGQQGKLSVFDAGVVILSRTGEIVDEFPAELGLAGNFWPDSGLMTEILRTDQPAYSDVLISTVFEDKDVVAVIVPIIKTGGTLDGAIVGMFDLGETAVSSFYAGIVRLRLQRSGSVYLVDSTGQLIFHSDSNFIGSKVSDHLPVQRVTSGNADSIRTDGLSGDQVVAAFSPIPGTGWGLVSEENWAALAGDSATFQRVLVGLLILGVILPAAIVAYGMRRLIRPLDELNQAAGAVGDGEYGRQVQVMSSDEFGQLGNSFNRMSEELKRSYEELEQRVEERTDELRLAELTNTRMIENSSNGVVFARFNRFTMVNAAAARILGTSRDELQSREIVEFFLDEDFVRLEEFLALMENAGDRVEDFEIGITRDDGSHAIISMTARRQAEEEGFAVEIILRDVTARHRTEEELFNQSRELAVVDERNRMSREIHDTIAQGLTGIVLQLEAAGEFTASGDPELQKHVDSARSLARESLTEARRSVWNLSPGALHSRSLSDALRDEIEKFDSRGAEHAEFAATGDAIELSSDTEASLFRICQEALINVRKYASATKISVSLRYEVDLVVLTIEDNGRGFDPSSTSSGQEGGFGLNNMRRRAQIEGGELEVDSDIGNGTKITVEIPV
ncbi:MAG: histidine kinase [Dehalococcoidia bacterium]